MAEEQLLKVPEVAERLRVRQETVRRWISEGTIHGTMVGGRRSGYRIPASEVDRILRGEAAHAKMAA